MKEPSCKACMMLNTSARNGFIIGSNHIKRVIHVVTTPIVKIRNTTLIKVGGGMHLLVPLET
jgi:hypothetical protein